MFYIESVNNTVFSLEFMSNSLILRANKEDETLFSIQATKLPYVYVNPMPANIDVIADDTSFEWVDLLFNAVEK